MVISSISTSTNFNLYPDKNGAFAVAMNESEGKITSDPFFKFKTLNNANAAVVQELKKIQYFFLNFFFKFFFQLFCFGSFYNPIRFKYIFYLVYFFG